MSKKRRAARDPVELGVALDALALASPAGVEHPPLTARQWELAVGSRIASKTRPWRLERGVLFVRVAHSVWASELQLLSQEIRDQLASSGITVDSLRFAVGRIERERARLAPPRKAPRPIALPPELERMVDGIGDESLKDALRRAAQVSLAAEARRIRN